MKKTRKFLSIFAVSLVAVFALSCCFFAACGNKDDDEKETEPTHTHTYSGDYYHDETGHWQLCAEDNEKGPVSSHTLGEVVVTEPADCVNEGKGTQTCTVCGYTKDVTIDPLGHDYSVYVSTTATCTVAGEDTYRCSRCDSTTTKSVEALGHDYEVTWTWAEDYSSATASRTACSRGDVEAEPNTTANVTSEAIDGGVIYTATVTFTDGTTATDTKTVYDEPEPPVSWESLPVDVDFNDASTYEGFMTVSFGVDNKGNHYIESNSEVNGIISYIVNDSSTTKLLTEDGVTALATGGATGSTKGIYFALDLSGYVGEYVKIEVAMAANTSTADTEDGGVTEKPRTLYLSENKNTPSIGADGVIDYAASLVKSSPATLSYVGEASSDLWYITCDANIVIYSIKISVANESEIPVVNEASVSSADELKAALENEVDEITLTADITGTFEISYEVTIDLAGYTIANAATDATHTIIVGNGGKLTVEDSGHGEDDGMVYGVIDSVVDGCAALCVEVGGAAILYGGTYTRSLEAGSGYFDYDDTYEYVGNSNGNSYYTIVNHGALYIADGVTVINNGSYSSAIENGWYYPSENTTNATASLTIGGGTFSGGLNTIKNDDCGELTIYGGTFTNETMYVVMNWSEVTIEGGAFTSDGGYDVIVNFGGKLTIGGGEFEAENYAFVLESDASDEATPEVTITGGTFKGTDDAMVVAVYAGTLAISGGTFAAANYAEEGGTYYYYDVLYAWGDGEITVNGGVVEGWMETGDGGAITIYGGYFTLDPSNYNGTSYVAEGYAATASVFEVEGETYTMYVVAAVGESRELSGSIDLTNAETYSGVEGIASNYQYGVTSTDTTGKTATVIYETGASFIDGVVTIYGAKETSTKTDGTLSNPMYYDSSNNYLVTNGASTSDGYYVKLDFSGYVGQVVTLNVVMSNTGDNEARSLLLSKTIQTSITDANTLAYVSSTSKSNGKVTLTYTWTISETELYLTWTKSIDLYSISVEIGSDLVKGPSVTSVTTKTVENTTIKVGSEDNKTVELEVDDVTMSDGSTYANGYTWEIVEGGDYVSIKAGSSGTKTTVTATAAGTAKIKVTVWYDGGNCSSAEITITVEAADES